jgi:uncharacterized protein YciW
MRKILALLVVFYSTAAFSQGNAPAQNTPPTVGGKPLVQVKPRGGTAPKSQSTQSIAQRLQACLEIDDATKDRLNCYDTIFPPKPKPKASAAKSVTDCRFLKEEDERLKCFNGFAERLLKSPR